MVDKIKLAFKAKFPTLNLSSKRSKDLFAKVAEKVKEDETLIDSTIDELDNFGLLTELAKADDVIRTAEKKAKESTTPPKKEDENTDEPVTVPPAGATEFEKTMLATMQKLTQTVNQLQGEKSANIIKDKIAAELKDVNPILWNKRALPEKDDAETIAAFVEDVKADALSLGYKMVDGQIGKIEPPKGANGTGDPGTGPKVKPEDVKDLVNNM